MADKTVSELKAAKAALSEVILEQVEQLESEYGIKVSSINLAVRNDKRTVVINADH